MLDVLLKWNRWGSEPLDGGIKRDMLERIVPCVDTKDIVVLMGPRRAGKTMIMYQIMNILGDKGYPDEAMLHVNLEEPIFAIDLSVGLLDKLYDEYRARVYPSGKAFLFFDEIQNIPGWEKWVRARNKTEDVQIFVTGSSAHLMSRELATVLTGRHISFNIFPLSFSELLRFKNIKIPKLLSDKPTPHIQSALLEYFQWGGFPEVVLANDDRRKELLLKQYFDDILFKDVAIRHNIRDLNMLRKIASYLLTQTGCLISYNRLAKQFCVSLDLAKLYCQYLQEAYLVDFSGFYSYKAAVRSRNAQKVYAVDSGVRNQVCITNSTDLGHIVESIAYNYLNRMHYGQVYYWKGVQEVDFVIQDGHKVVEVIQICYGDIIEPKTLTRELKALDEAKSNFHDCKIKLVSRSRLVDSESINQVFWRFLLNEVSSI
jgi:uncharacterized protein